MLALLEAAALAVHFQDVHLVGEPGQQRASQPLRARDISPCSWNPSLPTFLHGEQTPKLPNLPKRKSCRRPIESCHNILFLHIVNLN